MKGIRSVSRFMACGCPIVPTSFLEKAIVFLHSIAFASCQNVSSTQLDLQSQCKVNQNPSRLFFGY